MLCVGNASHSAAASLSSASAPASASEDSDSDLDDEDDDSAVRQLLENPALLHVGGVELGDGVDPYNNDDVRNCFKSGKREAKSTTHCRSGWFLGLSWSVGRMRKNLRSSKTSGKTTKIVQNTSD